MMHNSSPYINLLSNCNTTECIGSKDDNDIKLYKALQ